MIRYHAIPHRHSFRRPSPTGNVAIRGFAAPENEPMLIDGACPEREHVLTDRELRPVQPGFRP
jgi:hypothetical protein